MGSVVAQSAERPGFDSQRRKCWAQMEFVNIYQFRFHFMLNYACVYYVRFVLINLRHCDLHVILRHFTPPWRWLVAAYRLC